MITIKHKIKLLSREYFYKKKKIRCQIQKIEWEIDSLIKLLKKSLDKNVEMAFIISVMGLNAIVIFLYNDFQKHFEWHNPYNQHKNEINKMFSNQFNISMPFQETEFNT
jgi:hypothetical protein